MSEREKLAVEKFNELYKDGKIPENIANSDLYNIVKHNMQAVQCQIGGND